MNVETTSPTNGISITKLPRLRLANPHSLIRRTMDLKPVKDAYGYVREPDWPGVDTRVSKAMKRSALIALDRLFKALETVGITIEVVQHQNYYGNQGRGTFAARDGDKTQIYIAEAYRKVEHVPTAKELRDNERFSRLKIPKWEDVPTGTLTLEPGGVVDLSSEKALALVIAKAVEDTVHRLDEAQAKRKAAEEASRKEYLRQQAAQQEKGRVEALHKSSEALRRYQLLMDYIEEVRRFGQVPEDQRKPGQSIEEWLRWAEWQARLIHPLG